MIGLPSATTSVEHLSTVQPSTPRVASLVVEARRARLQQPAPRVALVGVRRGQVGVEARASRRGSATATAAQSGTQPNPLGGGVARRPLAVVAVVAEEPPGPRHEVDDDRGAHDGDEREQALEQRRRAIASAEPYADDATHAARPRAPCIRPNATRNQTPDHFVAHAMPSAKPAAQRHGRSPVLGPMPRRARPCAARSSGNAAHRVRPAAVGCGRGPGAGSRTRRATQSIRVLSSSAVRRHHDRRCRRWR